MSIWMHMCILTCTYVKCFNKELKVNTYQLLTIQISGRIVNHSKMKLNSLIPLYINTLNYVFSLLFLPLNLFPPPIRLIIKSVSQICYLLSFPYDKVRPLSFPTGFSEIVFNTSVCLQSLPLPVSSSPCTKLIFLKQNKTMSLPCLQSFSDLTLPSK